jgi:hypothetical protein
MNDPRDRQDIPTIRAAGVDDAARAIFDGTPHGHPTGHVPDWDVQPEHLKDVFRRKAIASDA